MAISSRQAELFAGETWDSIYQKFAQINFNASDPVSINSALQDYIRINYPEDFNDWIVSSEFVALIDLLSWLAGTLAYKTDLAARENFIDVAEARESILRLARFLSYNPNRCQTSNGILKVVDLTTDDDVFDSFGTNLANTTITWNDSNNANWLEQFTDVLNNAFVNTNPFGIPLKDGTVAGVATQLYRVNGRARDSSLRFAATVTGTSMDFEICNGDFTDGAVLFERTPDPSNAFNLFYLNDGNGSASARSGFFVLFKQGTTQQQTFNITVPIENQTLDIPAANVNQTDVWVQSIDDSGTVTTDWTKVPAILNSNVTFNDIPAAQRNIYSVLTRDNDQITIRFSDGRFGNAPQGLIQVTYRVSNGLSYQIRPLEINNISVPIRYYNAVGALKTLTLTLSLYETVSNAALAETVEQIRERAPRVYATQNRMVSGEDYNSFPLSSNMAAKIKAVNRVYSGQSRYIDLADPTGTYQDLSLFADDGILFADPRDTYIEIPASLNKTTDELIAEYLLPTLDQYTTTSLINDVLVQAVRTGAIVALSGNSWHQSSASLFETTGWFSRNDYLLQPGASVLFNLNGTPTWIALLAIDGAVTEVPASGTAGPVTLAQEVPSGTQVLAILPSASVLPDSTVMATIASNLTLRLSFSLWYDYNPSSSTGPIWVVGPAMNDFGAPPPRLAAINGGSGTQLAIMTMAYLNGMWQLSVRGLSYTFESINDIEWFDNGTRALAQSTGEAQRDTVRIMRINRDLNDTGGHALKGDINVAIDRLWLYPDGTAEPRRAAVLPYDSNQDGYPDIPDLFYRLVHPDPRQRFLFWSNASNPPYDQPLYTAIGYDTDSLRAADDPAVGTIGFQMTSNDAYAQDQTFWVYQGDHVWQPDLSGIYRFEVGRGPNVARAWHSAGGVTSFDAESIVFQWKHYAPSDHRIDPASTNIHDIFVLTFAYDTAIRQWISAGAATADMPMPPTELDLRLAFGSMEEFKMFSDQIVWRPVRYKALFGASANPELQAQFKVIRLQTAQISDGEIKSRIIIAINTYFAVNNWDFGETFYFTELAAYIHQQLSGLIGSIVLVPLAADAAFGDGFEVTCRADEMFISTAQVSDIVLIQSNTALNLRIRG